jgi:hypothetical protein
MPTFLLSVALLLPAALGMPVPQIASTTITGSGGRPVGTATLGGLTSSLELEGEPVNNLPYNGGGNQPPCRPWQSSCYNYPNSGNGNGWQNYGNNGNGWPSNNGNNNDWAPYQPRPCAPWDNSCDTSNYSPNSNLPNAPGGPAGTASVTTYGSGQPTQWGGNSFGTRDVAGKKPKSKGKPLPVSASSGAPSPAVATTPLAGNTQGGASLGGLTSSISFGPKSRRQNAGVLEDNVEGGFASLSGLESQLSTGSEHEVASSITFG